MLDPDDPIGRVGIQLGRLAGSTEYDLWLDLGYGAIEKPNGKLGCVRLRISVTFRRSGSVCSRTSRRRRRLLYHSTRAIIERMRSSQSMGRVQSRHTIGMC